MFDSLYQVRKKNNSTSDYEYQSSQGFVLRQHFQAKLSKHEKIAGYHLITTVLIPINLCILDSFLVALNTTLCRCHWITFIGILAHVHGIVLTCQEVIMFTITQNYLGFKNSKLVFGYIFQHLFPVI